MTQTVTLIPDDPETSYSARDARDPRCPQHDTNHCRCRPPNPHGGAHVYIWSSNFPDHIPALEQGREKA